MCLEYHIFHHPSPTFILVGVPLHALLQVGHQEFLTSFTHAVHHAVDDELGDDLLLQVMATTLEEELAPPCIDDVAEYFSLAEEEAVFQDLEQEAKPKTSHVELKQLPPGLQYVFLNGDHETPVIISNKLADNETRRLVATLEKHRSVIGYSVKDLKGISLSVCTHHIPMEQEHKPVHEHQRQLNNAMREVVKKEVLKPLKAGVIYLVSHSEWVSPIQVVLKKDGRTVIHNEKNQLIPQRTVTGWWMCIDYWKLNKATQKYHFPLPFINEMLETLANHSFFSYLEWREKAHHSAKLYQGRTKRWHDKRVKTKQFKPGDKILLFNSHVHLFSHSKLCGKWECPNLVLHATYHGVVTLQCNDVDIFKANGPRLKLFLKPNPQDFEEVDVLDFHELE
jgi:hypothetical protein